MRGLPSSTNVSATASQVTPRFSPSCGGRSNAHHARLPRTSPIRSARRPNDRPETGSSGDHKRPNDLLANAQDLLPMLAVGGTARECREGISKREDGIDFRSHVTPVNQPSYLDQLPAVGLDDEVVGAGRLLDNRDNSTGTARGVRQLFSSRGIEQQLAGLASRHHLRSSASGELHG